MSGATRCLYALTASLLLLGMPGRQKGFESSGLGSGGLPESFLRLRREAKREEKLDAELVRHYRSLPTKQRVAADLAAGRLGLLEAARAVRDLSSMPVHMFRESLKRAERGDSEGERICRHTIRFVVSTLVDHPEVAARVTARLEAELKEHLVRHGSVVLPEGKARAADAAARPGR